MAKAARTLVICIDNAGCEGETEPSPRGARSVSGARRVRRIEIDLRLASAVAANLGALGLAE